MKDLKTIPQAAIHTEPPERASRNRASLTFEKGLRILDCFDVDHPEWSMTDLCARTGIARPTAYRLVKTLTQAKYLVRDRRTDSYHLGPALLKTAYLMFSNSELVRIAHPFLEDLVAETNESAVLAIWRDGDSLLLDVVIANRPFIPVATPGSIVPGYSTIHGKLFLASRLDDPDLEIPWDEIVQYTQYTVTDPEELKQVLRQVNQEGVAFSLQEWKVGMCAVGAPILSPNHIIAASLGLVVPNERFGPAEMRLCAAAVKRTATQITDRLNHRHES